MPRKRSYTHVWPTFWAAMFVFLAAFPVLFATVYIPAAEAQILPTAKVTYILPRDFGQDVDGSKIAGFENCDQSPDGTGRYQCDEIEVGQNSRIEFTEAVNIETSESFVLPQNTLFNPFCESVNFYVTGGGGDFELGSNIEFNADIEATQTILINSNSTVNGNATASVIDIGSNSEINGTCNPSNPSCGGEPMCTPITAEITKTASRDVVAPGEEFTYTLEFTNTGNQDISAATVTDVVPINTTFVRASSGGVLSGSGEAGDTVTWTTDLPVGGAPFSVTMTVKVDNGVADGTIITNSAAFNAPGAAEALASVDVLVDTLPQLLIEKTANVRVVDPGGLVTYTLKLENVGNAEAFNVVLVDNLAPETTFISATGGGVEIAPGIVEWIAPRIQVGSSTSVTLTVQVLDVTAPSTLIINTATVESDESGPESAQALVVVASTPLVVIEKTSDIENVNAGGRLNYTLTYSNVGSQSTQNVFVYDDLPLDTRFVSASAGGEETPPGSGRVIWDTADLGGELNPGQSGSVTLAVDVLAPLPDGTRLINRSGIVEQAGARFGYSEKINFVRSAPVLSITKIVDKDQAQPGDALAYLIEIENTGNARAFDLVVEDILPSELTVSDFTEGGAVGGENSITWEIPELGLNNPVQLVIEGDLDRVLPDQSVVENKATLTNLTEEFSKTDQAITRITSEATFSIVKTAFGTEEPEVPLTVANPGDEIIYEIAFENIGNAIASGTLIEDVLPQFTSFVSASDSGAYDPGTGLVTWMIGEVVPGTPGQVSLTVAINETVPVDSEVDNTVTIDALDTRSSVANSKLRIDSAPDLKLVKTASTDFINPGEELTYLLDIGNAGNANAVNAILEEPIPANTTFVSATGPFALENNILTWSVQEIAAGASGSVSFTVKADFPLADGTTIENTANLSASNSGSTIAKDNVTVDSQPELVLTKEASASNVQPGDLLTYTLSVTNTGNTNALNTVVTDTVPANTTFLSADSGGVETDGKVVWNVGNIVPTPPGDPGARASTVSMTVQVNTPLDNGIVIENLARAKASNSNERTATVNVSVDSSARLELSKTADQELVKPGDFIRYTLSAENTGNATARSTTLTEDIPQYTTLISAPGAIVNGRSVQWFIDDLVPGLPAQSFQMTVEVDDAVDTNTSIRNLASLSATDALSRLATEKVDVNSRPLLEITKVASIGEVVPGDEITYTLTYSNKGNAAATAASLVDSLPARTTFKSATGGGVAGDGLVTWSLGRLEAGSTGQVTVTVQVDPAPIADGTLLSNIATINANDAVSEVAQESVVVTTAPVLQLKKQADRTTAAPGDQILYTLSPRNTGNDVARDVLLEDRVPQNTTFVSATGPFTRNGDQIQWSATSLAPGQTGSVTFTVQADEPLNDGTVIRNNATVSATDTSSANDATNVTVISSPVLNLNKSAPLYAQPGDEIAYSLTYQNLGNAIATDVRLTDTLPANTTFVSATGGGSFDGTNVSWGLGDLTPSATPNNVSFTVAIDSPQANGTVISNTATLADDTGNSTTDSANTQIISSPALSLAKNSIPSDSVLSGETVTYTLTIGNDGNEVAKSVTLTDTLPADITYLDSSGGSFAGGVVTWQIPSVRPGELVSETVRGTVNTPLPNATQLINSAFAKAANAAGVSATSSLLVSSLPAMALSKTADETTKSPGETITYTLAFSNTGTANASSVILEDNIPQFTTFVSASDGGVEDAGRVVWNLGTLNTGTSGQVSAVFAIDAPPISDGTVIANTATLDSVEAPPITASEMVTINSNAALSLTKTSSTPVIAPGDELDYTLQFSNTGNDTATSVVLTDTLPENVELVFATGEFSQSGRQLIWNFDSVAPDASGSVVITVRAANTIAENTPLLNVATLTSAETQPVEGRTLNFVRARPVLELDKTADRAALQPGAAVEYTLSFANRGNATAQGTVLQDTLPTNTSFVSASDGGTHSSGVVSWNIGELLAESSGSVSLSLRVDPAAVEGDAVINSAQLAANNAGSATDTLSLQVTTSPVLSISKSADVNVVEAGGEINYTINYANVGNGSAGNAIVTDTLPTGTKFIAAPGGSFDGATVTWNVGTVAAGGIGELSLTVNADDGLLPGDTVINSASIVSDDTQPAVSNDVVIAVFEPTSPPILGVSLTGSPAVVDPGEEINYEIVYSNASPSEAASARLIGVIPSDTTFVSASDGGELKSNGSFSYVEWTALTLPGLIEGAVSYRVRESAEATSRLLAQSTTTPRRSIAPTQSTGRATITAVTTAPYRAAGQAGADTTRLLTTYAAIDATNFSPPASDSATVFVRVENIDPAPEATPVPITNLWQLALLISLLFLLGSYYTRRKRSG